MLRHDLPHDHFEQYIERIQQLTSQDLLSVQKNIYNRSTWVIGAGGVASVIESAIAPFAGRVLTWDAAGY